MFLVIWSVIENVPQVNYDVITNVVADEVVRNVQVMLKIVICYCRSVTFCVAALSFTSLLNNALQEGCYLALAANALLRELRIEKNLVEPS
jgi:hypothetical protein